MANTVVVFGMAHSGKTTCCGYIYNQSKQGDNNYDFESYINEIKKDLGEEYDSSRDFGYLLEKSKDERLRNNKSGTSKELHIKSIHCCESEFVIIDTPGAQHKATQRQKGMYYGDIGVFCVEISKILDERFWGNRNHYLTFMSTLILWSRFKRRTIILLTKMDIVEFSEEKYKHACGIIKQICKNIDVSSIIPISINVKKRTGNNIFEKSSSMPWYTGKSLMPAIKDEFNNIIIENNDKTLIFYVDRNYMKSNQYTGKSWRIKVIKGSLKRGQKICLSPVVINNGFFSVTATIKSIRADLDSDEGIQNIDCASEGDFVGIDIADIYCNKKRIDKHELDTIYTTCGFPSDLQFAFSDKFTFRVGVQYLEKLNVKRQMDLLWFGRAVTFEIISRKNAIEGIEVHARMINRFLTMPLDKNGKYIIDCFIIRYDHNLNQDPFMEAKLLKIGE